MTNHITGTALALSLVFTSISATPSFAGPNEDLNRFLAGAVTLLILGKALESKNESKTKTQKLKNTQPDHVSRYKPNRTRPSRTHYILPAGCQFAVRTSKGLRNVFGKHCLTENARLPRLLPKRCEEVVRIRHGRRAEVYDSNCLFDRGYRVAGRKY